MANTWHIGQLLAFFINPKPAEGALKI